MRKARIRVFVSATSDLEAEREVVGEALARFPVPLAWEIKRTPRPGEQVPQAVQEVRQSDFCLILLGQDITAPVGAELEMAQEAGVSVLALAKEGPHTPAGRFFRHNSVEKWESFTRPHQLRRLVVDYLVRAIANDPLAYGLSVDEIAGLMEYLREKEGGKKAQAEDELATGKEPAGAQDAAVIVAPASDRRRRS